MQRDSWPFSFQVRFSTLLQIDFAAGFVHPLKGLFDPEWAVEKTLRTRMYEKD